MRPSLMIGIRIVVAGCLSTTCLTVGPLVAQVPHPVPSSLPSAAPPPAASPAPTSLAQSVSTLSAQRAAAERSKIYRAGAAYSRWLDGLASKSGVAFLQRTAFGRATWFDVLVSAITLSVLGLGAAWFLSAVRRRAGRIDSSQHQSVAALAAAAIRKPVALYVLVVGGVLAVMPLVTGIADRPTRIFFTRFLTAIFYAGQVLTVLWLILRAIRALEKRMTLWADRGRSLLGKVVVPIFAQTLQLSVPLLGIILLLPLLKLPTEWNWITQEGFGILLILSLSFLIVRGVNAIQHALLSTYRLDTAENLSARRIYTQVSVIRKIVVTSVVIIAAGSILMLFDPVRQFGTSILASAGIAGIVIGFAAQRTLGNVLAGIQIALTQPLLIDDIVVVEGEFGQIEEITLTYVTVRTWDLRRIILPITYFVEKPFQNWSRVSTELLGTVVLHLDYQVPMPALRKELKRLLENNPKWDRKVCALQMTDTTPTTVEVRALISSTDPGKASDLRCEIREGLVEFVRSNYPESLPRIRSVTEQPPRTHRPGHGDGDGDGAADAGKEHERGSTSPGVHPEDAVERPLG